MMHSVISKQSILNNISKLKAGVGTPIYLAPEVI